MFYVIKGNKIIDAFTDRTDAENVAGTIAGAYVFDGITTHDVVIPDKRRVNAFNGSVHKVQCSVKYIAKNAIRIA